jgi:hypothetical protein
MGQATMEQYETMLPCWEYVGKSQWELKFIDTDDWIHVKAMGPNRAICLKKARKLKLFNGGLVVHGQEPMYVLSIPQRFPRRC